MLKIIQDDIIAQLRAIASVKTVASWQGEIADLLKMPQKMPALHVIYQGAKFEPFDQVGEPTISALEYLIVLIAQNVKSRQDGSDAAYINIEAVRDKLIGHQVSSYGFLRPVSEDLLVAEGGILAYGLVYSLGNVLVATE